MGGWYAVFGDRARLFSNLRDIYKVAKVVHLNWLDNHCNRSDTWRRRLYGY